MTQLSPHFSLAEFTFSDTAARMGISNDPSPEVIENLRRTANGLERVRQLLNSNAIHVNSGYRCKELNAAVHGQVNSQHVTGQAVDFTTPYGPPDQIVRLIRNAGGIQFDQLICEFGSWTHISFSDNPRYQVLRIDKLGTREFR